MQRCVARIKPSSDPDSSALVERLRDSIAVVNL